MNRSEHIQSLLEEYAAQRVRNETELDGRVRDAEARDPEIRRLREDNVSLALNTIRGLLAMSSAEARKTAAEEMKQRGIANNAELRRRLRNLGLPEDQLELRYRCSVCRDTAYVGDAPSRFCECFETRLRQRIYEDGSMAGITEQCFENFDAERIPETDGQREKTINAGRLCEMYADAYPDVRRPNLLFTGAAGLGKTFLLNCVYARVTQRGQSAVRVTAFRLFDSMRARHLGEEDGRDSFRELVEAPLLLIDDLGTEPMMRNITVEYLFMLLNERAIARRGTVIATNLTPRQLQERYGERVCSRILDSMLTTPVALTGKSLRV